MENNAADVQMQAKAHSKYKSAKPIASPLSLGYNGLRLNLDLVILAVDLQVANHRCSQLTA